VTWVRGDELNHGLFGVDPLIEKIKTITEQRGKKNEEPKKKRALHFCSAHGNRK
jgi:hypothetical protein